MTNLQTVWTKLNTADFKKALEIGADFHDAGFFECFTNKGIFNIVIHPIYFVGEGKYNYNGLDACELKIHVTSVLSDNSVVKALEAFTILEFEFLESEFHFSFSDFDLRFSLNANESFFRFTSIPKGKDYWSTAH